MNAPVQHILGTAHDLAKWRGQVDRANKVSGGVMSFEQIAEGIDEGRYFMFATDEAFVVLNPQKWASGLHLFIISAGGSQKGIENLYTVVSVWGRIIGARKLVAACRKGFSRRHLKQQGWKQPLIYIEKEI